MLQLSWLLEPRMYQTCQQSNTLVDLGSRSSRGVSCPAVVACLGVVNPVWCHVSCCVSGLALTSFFLVMPPVVSCFSDAYPSVVPTFCAFLSRSAFGFVATVGNVLGLVRPAPALATEPQLQGGSCPTCLTLPWWAARTWESECKWTPKLRVCHVS